jgi:hypothetical protein
MDIPHVSGGGIRSQANFQRVPELNLDIAALVVIRDHLGGSKRPLRMKCKGQDCKQEKKEQGVEPANRSNRPHCKFLQRSWTRMPLARLRTDEDTSIEGEQQLAG